MSERVDRYPTRDRGATRLLPREEPVVLGTRAGPLSAAQLADYERDGVLVLEGVFGPDTLAATVEVLSAAERIHGGVDEGVVREPETGELRSIFAVHAGRGPLARLTRHPVLVGAARQILGDEVYVHQSRVNFKPALGGTGFSWHSDFETWHAEDGMPAMRALSASVMLDDNETWNGPLFVLPGSHRTFVSCPKPTPPEHHKVSLVDQEVGTPSRAALQTLFERVGRIDVALGRAGTVVLFDCNALHASGSNLSPVPRRNLFLVYNAMSNQLEAPFGGTPPRPSYLANRSAEVISDERRDAE
jgi:ectoine hydroxylase